MSWSPIHQSVLADSIGQLATCKQSCHRQSEPCLSERREVSGVLNAPAYVLTGSFFFARDWPETYASLGIPPELKNVPQCRDNGPEHTVR